MDEKLVMQWAFDVPDESEYAAQGNHGLSINDVDKDGYDEIIYGSLVLDHNGQVLYSTDLGHGDAMHVSDWNNDGRLEVFSVHEEAKAKYHTELHDAETGEILWGYFNGKDTGRGVAADIDPRYEGAEMWSAITNVTYDCKGNIIYEAKPRAALLRMVAQKNGMKANNLYPYLAKYWKRGKTPNAFLPDYRNCGRSRNYEKGGYKKLGRPAQSGHGFGKVLQEEDFRNFDKAIRKYYLTRKEMTFQSAYERLLADSYTVKSTDQQGFVSLHLLPEDKIPSISKVYPMSRTK